MRNRQLLTSALLRGPVFWKQFRISGKISGVSSDSRTLLLQMLSTRGKQSEGGGTVCACARSPLVNR